MASWHWDFGDGNTSEEQNPSYEYDQDGNYDVCLIANSLCGTDTSCQTLNVFTGIESLKANQLRIYPNPSNGVIRISYPNQNNIITLQVLDMLGSEMLSYEAPKKNIDLKFLEVGTYLVKFTSDSGNVMYRKLFIVDN